MSKIDKKTVCLALLIALLIFHIVNNIIFISIYPLAEGKDSYAHITAFNNFCQIIENGKLNPFYVQGKSLLHNLVFVVIDYPPLFYFNAFIFKLLFGGLFLNAAIFISTVYLLVLLFSVYAIGEMINPQTGIIAAFICSMYPMIFLSSRHFSLELMLCALTTASMLVLLKTNYFLNRKLSVSLGIIFGLGMLAKQTFLIYIAGPFLVYSIYSLGSCRREIRRLKIINMLICSGLFLGLSLLFYLNKDIYINIFNRVGFLGAVNNDNLYSFEHISYYLICLRNTIGMFFIAVFLVALFNIRKIRNPFKWIFISWICLPLIFFTCIKLKYGEYTISYLPAIALISAGAIMNIKQNKLRVSIVMVVIFAGILNYFSLTFAKSVMFYSTYHAINPQCEILSHLDAPAKSAGENAMQEVINDLGNRNHKVGIFYDNIELDFPSYLIRSLFATTRSKAQIVDFLFRSSAFTDNVYVFDIMIYITKSEKKWTDKNAFLTFIQKFNSNFFADIDVREDFIDALVSQNKEFELVNSMKFQTGVDHESLENVYIYKRIK